MTGVFVSSFHDNSDHPLLNFKNKFTMSRMMKYYQIHSENIPCVFLCNTVKIPNLSGLLYHACTLRYWMSLWQLLWTLPWYWLCWMWCHVNLQWSTCHYVSEGANLCVFQYERLKEVFKYHTPVGLIWILNNSWMDDSLTVADCIAWLWL
jgi:hypothetical protein